MRRKFKEALLSPAVWLTLLAGGVALLNVAENYKGRTGSTDVFTYLDYARNLWNGMGFVGRIHLSFDLWARGFDPIPMESNRLLHPLALLLGRLRPEDQWAPVLLAQAHSGRGTPFSRRPHPPEYTQVVAPLPRLRHCRRLPDPGTAGPRQCGMPT